MTGKGTRYRGQSSLLLDPSSRSLTSRFAREALPSIRHQVLKQTAKQARAPCCRPGRVGPIYSVLINVELYAVEKRVLKSEVKAY
jgi:hypothetical protein